MRILVVEDNRDLADVMEVSLRKNGFAVDVAASGAHGEQLANERIHDALILDRLLPDQDGVDICRRLRTRGMSVRVLIVSGLTTTQEKVRGLAAGADDYLVKPFEMGELIARLRALLRRGALSGSRFLRCRDLHLDLETRIARRGKVLIALSKKETAVLEYLMRNPNRVLSRFQLAAAVWDRGLYTDSNVLEVNICSLRRKIDRGFANRLIYTVKGAGYRFDNI